MTAVWRFGPAAVQALLIFGLSSQPGNAYPDVSLPGADKVVHFALYAPLGAALGHALNGRVVLPALLATLYGVSDELHQAFVPHRSPDVFDVAADGLGGTCGALYMARRRRRKAPAPR